MRAANENKNLANFFQKNHRACLTPAQCEMHKKYRVGKNNAMLEGWSCDFYRGDQSCDHCAGRLIM